MPEIRKLYFGGLCLPVWEEKKDLYRKQSFVLSFSHAEAPVPTPEGPGERIVRYLDLYPKKIK